MPELSEYTAALSNVLGSEFCIECNNVQQRSDSRIATNSLVIIPRLKFSCNGRITNVRAGLDRLQNNNNFLTFQLWRPLLSDTMIYNKVGEIQLQSESQVTEGYNNFEATIILTGEKRLEFQPGDVIGYYHPPRPHYRVLDVGTMGYKLYRFDETSPPDTLNLSEANKTLLNRQPLLQFTIGKIINALLCQLFSLQLLYYVIDIISNAKHLHFNKCTTK